MKKGWTELLQAKGHGLDLDEDGLTIVLDVHVQQRRQRVLWSLALGGEQALCRSGYVRVDM